jgi:hypothetical protein
MMFPVGLAWYDWISDIYLQKAWRKAKKKRIQTKWAVK